MVVAQLRDEVVGMKQIITNLQSQNKPHNANTHIPMSVEEASAYLKMPMATLYMKLGNGNWTSYEFVYFRWTDKGTRTPFSPNGNVSSTVSLFREG